VKPPSPACCWLYVRAIAISPGGRGPIRTASGCRSHAPTDPAQAAIPYYSGHRAVPHRSRPWRGRREEVLTLWSGLGTTRAPPICCAPPGRWRVARVPRQYQTSAPLRRWAVLHAAAFEHGVWAPHAVVMATCCAWWARENDAATSLAAYRSRFRRGAGWLDPRHPGLFTRPSWSSPTVCLPASAVRVARSLRCAARGKVRRPRVARQSVRPGRAPSPTPSACAKGGVSFFGKGRLPRADGRFLDLPAPEDLPRLREPAPLGEFRHTIRITTTPLPVAAAGHGAYGPHHPRFRWSNPAALTGIPLSIHGSKSAEAGRNPLSTTSTAASGIPRAAGRLASCAPSFDGAAAPSSQPIPPRRASRHAACDDDSS